MARMVSVFSNRFTWELKYFQIGNFKQPEEMLNNFKSGPILILCLGMSDDDYQVCTFLICSLSVAGSMPDLEEFNLQICFTTEMASLRTSVSNAITRFAKGKIHNILVFKSSQHLQRKISKIARICNGKGP